MAHRTRFSPRKYSPGEKARYQALESMHFAEDWRRRQPRKAQLLADLTEAARNTAEMYVVPTHQTATAEVVL